MVKLLGVLAFSAFIVAPACAQGYRDGVLIDPGRLS
jgi:hypothetical protein